MKFIGQEQAERLSERHFTVTELSEQWNLSREAVRKMFENEPDVAVFYHPKPNKRRYRTLRIPEGVAKRVYQRSLVLMKPQAGKEQSSLVGASSLS
jgi:hypothetical protein